MKGKDQAGEKQDNYCPGFQAPKEILSNQYQRQKNKTGKKCPPQGNDSGFQIKLAE